MAGERRPKRRRVLIEDARSDGRFLRATWHADRRQFVLSTWSDELCTGAVRLAADEVPALVTLLVDGLADAAGPRGSEPARRAPARSAADLRTRVRSWLRGRRDQVATVLGSRAPAPPPARPSAVRRPPERRRDTA
jgi:hypothetical protein